MNFNLELRRETDKQRRFHLRFSSEIYMKNFLVDFFKYDQNKEILNIRMWVDEE